MIEFIEIKQFKSIKNLQMNLQNINILIGGNGAGKSNFISFFKLINAIFNNRLQRYVADEKVDNILYFGRKQSEGMEAKLIFSDDEGANNNAYIFGLGITSEGGLYLDFEGTGYNVKPTNNSSNYFYKYALNESFYAKDNFQRNIILQNYISSLQVFHFHDTSATSYLRRESDINDNNFLRQDGRNLAAYMYFIKLQHPKTFNRIQKTIRSVAPYIENFILEPTRLKKDEVALRWTDSGDPDSNFSAYQLSDGTLRFIALAVLLMQPEPPAIIIIDEPELGLHPFAIVKLAGMIHAVADKCQLIAATQSPAFISHFKPEDIIVADRHSEEKQSVFKRLDSDKLGSWLNEFTLGELWERDILDAAQPFIKV